MESNNALSAIQDLDDRFLDEATEWTENRVHMRRSIGIIGMVAAIVLLVLTLAHRNRFSGL